MPQNCSAKKQVFALALLFFFTLSTQAFSQSANASMSGTVNTESYDHVRDNPFRESSQSGALSTFWIDGDTASYSNMRRFLDNGQFPPVDAVRIEEFINYFDYAYKPPEDGKPFAVDFELTEAPWNPSHRLLRIAIKGREVRQEVLAERMNATPSVIAKHVKVQVEFNPRHVGAYRLIGYEDRDMAREGYYNSANQAGIVGAGHAVTALYELVPPGEISEWMRSLPPRSNSDEVATISIRSKDPEKDVSVLSEYTVKESESRFQKASVDFKFAASVAAFGMILRNSPYKGSADFVNVLDWANAGKGEDARGYRAEFIRLVSRARSMAF
jgi:hypothetical protein